MAYIADQPYFQAVGGAPTVEVWHFIAQANKWVVNQLFGAPFVLNGNGTTLFTSGGGGIGTPWIHNVPTFLRVVVPNGCTLIACGMLGNNSGA